MAILIAQAGYGPATLPGHADRTGHDDPGDAAGGDQARAGHQGARCAPHRAGRVRHGPAPLDARPDAPAVRYRPNLRPARLAGPPDADFDPLTVAHRAGPR